MRTHAEIVEQAKVKVILRQLAALGVELKDPTVRSWMNRSLIPPEFWQAFVTLGFATMEELAAGVTKLKQPALAQALEGLAPDSQAA